MGVGPMTKQEIEQAIENGESVWGLFGGAYEIKLSEHREQFFDRYNNYCYRDKNGEDHCCDLQFLYKTKAEAEHYLNHANITRTEHLPFLTWEEFLKEIQLKFIACDGVSNMTLYCCNNTIYLVDEEYPEFNTTSWELTEENFYKAYDECVRLFRGEE